MGNENNNNNINYNILDKEKYKEEINYILKFVKDLIKEKK